MSSNSARLVGQYVLFTNNLAMDSIYYFNKSVNFFIANILFHIRLSFKKKRRYWEALGIGAVSDTGYFYDRRSICFS